MEFHQAIVHILKSEGGYVNDPTDRGGETKYGIASKYYPNEDIKGMTEKRAKEIYWNDYWLKSFCDKLPPEVRLMHFDTSVNMGISRASKFLQESIGVTVDGIVGKITLSKAHKCDLKTYSRLRLTYYTKIILNKPKQIKYINGWFNRVLDVLIHSI